MFLSYALALLEGVGGPDRGGGGGDLQGARRQPGRPRQLVRELDGEERRERPKRGLEPVPDPRQAAGRGSLKPREEVEVEQQEEVGVGEDGGAGGERLPALEAADLQCGVEGRERVAHERGPTVTAAAVGGIGLGMVIRRRWEQGFLCLRRRRRRLAGGHRGGSEHAAMERMQCEVEEEEE